MRFTPAFNFLRRAPTTARRTGDPADMGTAFGMEATLEAAAALPSYPLESQRAHPPLDNPMAWMRNGHRKPGAL